MDEQAPTGRAILALITALVGVLGVLMSGAIWLMDSAAGMPADHAVVAWLLAFGLLYLLLAYLLFTAHALAGKLAIALLVAIVVVGTQGHAGAERMALGVMLVLALAAVVSIVTIMSLFLIGRR